MAAKKHKNVMAYLIQKKNVRAMNAGNLCLDRPL